MSIDGIWCLDWAVIDRGLKYRDTMVGLALGLVFQMIPFLMQDLQNVGESGLTN